MTNNTYLISVEKIKDNSPIPLTLDDKYIQNNLLIIQNIHLSKLLGSNLYDKIIAVAQTLTGTTYTPTDYTTLLLEYIHPYIINATVEKSLITLQFKISNRGITTGQDDNQNALDLESFKYFLTYFKSTAELYADKLRRYLITNDTLYPEYLNGNDDFDDDCPDLSKQGTCSIYLEKNNDCEYDSNYIPQ